MAITDLQIAVMRALLASDFDTYERLVEQLDREADQDYGLLIGAAFFEAVDRRFANGYSRSDIVQLVASVRARFEQSGRDFDPRAVEDLMLSVFEDVPAVADVDDFTVGKIQTVFSAALINDEQLDDAELDQFMAVVRTIAEDWAAERADAP